MIGADVLAAHGLAYRFLGSVFSAPPEQALVRQIVDDDLFAEWPLPSEEADVRIGLALLRDHCRSDGAALLAPLAGDYGRLFEIPGDAFVRPWESVYRSKDHLLFERETEEVGRWYRRFGMEAPSADTEPPDHLGLELRFVAHLCGLAVAAQERSESGAFREVTGGLQGFLEDHLARWAGECLAGVIANARTDYYRGAAYLARGCIGETLRLVASPSREVP
jgi:TorA maturation chaperone TorD